MAPKKQQQQKRQKQIANQKSSSSKSKSQSSDSKSTPKLQISAENERRLRRLLLNTDRPPAPSQLPNDTALSKSQKAKRLHSIYEKLSCEGFTADQIEQALSMLNDGATFEAALDWLCLNIPGQELPLKFSSGTKAFTQEEAERSVSVISSAREDWLPSRIPSAVSEEQMPGIFVRQKGSQDDESLDLGKPSQADWIRQYVQQQEEEDWEALSGDGNEEGTTEEVSDPSSRAISIAKEFQAARLAAVEAKEKRDKKSQEQAGNIIRRLKQEMSSLGLSDDILESGFRHESTLDCLSEAINIDSSASKESESEPLSLARSRSELTAVEDHVVGAERMWDSSSEGKWVVAGPVPERITVEDEANDVDFSNLFSEDACVGESLPSKILKIQQKERIAQSAHEQSLGKLDELWKKGESAKIPKAVLQQLCQRLGWEAPKYNRVSGKGNDYAYTVSVLRTASGRGKSRKAGGLITSQLPDSDETFESAEDSQNKVAAYALYQLFPNLPTYQLLLEPYSSLVKRWQEGETSIKIEETEEIRRAGFVDSLLSIDHTVPTNLATFVRSSPQAEHSKPPFQESNSTAKDERVKYHKVESSFLKQDQEKKMKLKKYKEMLAARVTLPISELKSHFLKLLKENDVLVVCGETGCGKTTQVPQFILDDMIESNLGGFCSIVCTQPRRIAAISVAERVADERCEPYPGSDGSLVGYQVRLDSARNVKTKILFCTTGILLRRLAGDKELSGISHIIVDEVHERSLLGDFLLIILKNLIERQSAHGTQKLKVILMSATVDAQLFSRYFGNCPVITAEGRTHPVTSYFLEDVYDMINYRLASDSPASLTSISPRREKVGKGRVDNHRGKKNLVMSGWGDESLLSESCINPHYDPTAYGSYGDRTRQNLRNLNEDVIDYDLLEDLVCYVDETYPGGAILVFLPGVQEIYMLVDKLAASYQFGGGSSAEWILPLHSSLASVDQRKVFQSSPTNIRKVIVATDIAETSITIDDVVYVIDCGKHKENRYNPQKKMSSMVEDWISQANAKQRRGRAGRVKPGICFCLYTHHRFEKLMRPYQVPEMLRMPLVELCLQIKSLSLGDIRTFLSKAIEPPREEAINSAIATLYEVGAIEEGEELTPLGYHLAKLPVDVLIGKMMLYGCIFGCLSPILSIAGFLSYKPPFIYPKDEKQNVERAKLSILMEKLDNVKPDERNRQSDHLLMAIAYDKWVNILHEKGAKAANQFCKSYFLNNSVMYMIRDMRIQFGSLLADIGILNLPKLSQTDAKMKDKLDGWFTDLSQPFNIYSHHSSIVKSILCAGLYPNVAATEDGIVSGALSCNRSLGSNPTKGRPIWYDGRREVHIHPSSINNNVKDTQYPFLVFLEKVETSKVFLRDTSIISPYSILLFGGSINVQHQTGLVTIDGWLNLTAPAQTAVLFKELRLMLHSVLKELIRKPEMATVVDNEVVRSIIHLLLEEDKPPK